MKVLIWIDGLFNDSNFISCFCILKNLSIDVNFITDLVNDLVISSVLSSSLANSDEKRF